MAELITPRFEERFIQEGTAEDGSHDLKVSRFVFQDGDDEIAVHALVGQIYSIGINGSELPELASTYYLQSHFLDAYINGIALPFAPELVSPAIETVWEMGDRSRLATT